MLYGNIKKIYYEVYLIGKKKTKKKKEEEVLLPIFFFKKLLGNNQKCSRKLIWMSSLPNRLYWGWSSASLCVKASEGIKLVWIQKEKQDMWEKNPVNTSTNKFLLIQKYKYQ
jgi:hypothetical protein